MKAVIGMMTLLLGAAAAWAQQGVSVKPGILSHIEDAVYLDNAPVRDISGQTMEIPKGSCVQTGAGKAEIQLGMASTLWMGEQGRLCLETVHLSEPRIRAERGSAFIEIIESYKGHAIVIHAGEAMVRLKDAGVYRLDFDLAQLHVYEGRAEIRLKDRKTAVKSGKIAGFSGAIKTWKADTREQDGLHDWASQRSYVLYGRIKENRRAAFMARQAREFLFRLQMAEFRYQADRQIRMQNAGEESPPGWPRQPFSGSH